MVEAADLMASPRRIECGETTLTLNEMGTNHDSNVGIRHKRAQEGTTTRYDSKFQKKYCFIQNKIIFTRKIGKLNNTQHY